MVRILPEGHRSTLTGTYFTRETTDCPSLMIEYVLTNALSIILSAFERVKWLERLYEEDIPWSEIEHGFTFQDEQLYLANKARGIFRPRQMQRGVLSIKTTMPRAGRYKMYEDEETEEGYFRYALQRGDPMKQGNRYLWEALEDQTPFIKRRSGPVCWTPIRTAVRSPVCPSANYWRQRILRRITWLTARPKYPTALP